MPSGRRYESGCRTHRVRRRRQALGAQGTVQLAALRWDDDDGDTTSRADANNPYDLKPLDAPKYVPLEDVAVATRVDIS